MNLTTYIRTIPFPKCKSCGLQLDFYVIGVDDNEHECDQCWINNTSDKISNALIEEVKKQLGDVKK